MNTPRVNREQAEGLKKVGYDVKVTGRYSATFYHEEPIDDYVMYNWNISSVNFSAPTLDEAARWLRDVKGWHVAVDTTGMGWYLFCTEIEVGDMVLPTKNNFPTHDLALSAGIDLILKKLEDGK